MAAIWMRVRLELRGRWTSSVVIVLLIGLAGGVALTAAAGARRTDTAYPRFLKATNSEDFLVSAFYLGTRLYADIARLPQVAISGVVDGLPLFYSPRHGHLDQNVQVIASANGVAGYTVERLHMLEGRPPRSGRPFEAAASLTFSKKYDLHTGDRVSFYAVNTRTSHLIRTTDGKPLRYTLRITGVEVSFDEIIPIAPQDSLPQLFTTPALARRFPDRSQLNYDGTLVKLRPGADPGVFRRDVQLLARKHPEAGNVVFADEIDHHARVQQAIRPEAIALSIFALLTGVAGLLAIAQILSRRIFLDAADYPTLRSLGMSKYQLVVVAAIRGMALAVAGGGIAVGVAILASPLMPIGPARIAEPSRGFEVNIAVLGVGFGVVVLMITAIACFAGWRAARAEGMALGTVEVRGADRPSRVAASASRAGLGPSVVSGVRFALEPGRGRTAVPVRTAMIGIVLAVAAITASFTFGTNLSRLVSTPSQYGRTWGVDLDTGFGAIPRSRIEGVFGSDRDVAAYAGGQYGSVAIRGHSIPAVAIDPLKGTVFPTLISGRAPENGGEIALGTNSLHLVGASVGDTIVVRSGGGQRRMRIVGQAVFPAMGQGSFNPTGLGEGAATVSAGMPSPFPPPGTYSFVLARFGAGVNPAAALREISHRARTAKLCPSDQLCAWRTVQLPAQLSTYADIRTVPLVLALLLILMGIAVTAHTLVTSVQRRRRDLATLKTLGFVRPQILATVASQASTFAAVGLILGLPLGIAAGRWAWTLFANQLGAPPSVRLPALAIGIAVPSAILIANAVAALPGRSAAQTQPALVLRTE